MALQRLYEVILDEEHFDLEDMELVKQAIDLEAKQNEHLQALKAALPRRQDDLKQLDEEFNLTQKYPELMKAFARKDAELQQNLHDLEEEERRRSQRIFHAPPH